ncbi:WecB/TagA/CpsF family glycosyltransferase [Salinibacter ruber]|uniref:WecB/TagA/CpsF family glycosyltransferase n=1 Tax=Salinibacter ruber TaxID=146919 RepID=UPI001967D82D|nr:WecB/TagA/CpsF family glycosyltransferase [Salinibacter ruber]
MNDKIETVPVIGIPLYAENISSAVRHVVSTIEESSSDETWLISATGAHGLVHAQQTPEFRKLLRRFHLNLPDGKPAVWVGRWKGAKEMGRCYGPDFFATLMEASADQEISHYLCGGAEGVADELKKACATKFDNQRIVGTHCPPFRPLTEDEFAQLGRDIDEAEADIVWIGISTPKQERFAAQLSECTSASFIITVGAAFDFHIGNVRQAPTWMQEAGLEWFFRLLMEPRRLFKREMTLVSGFIYYNLKELLTGRFFEEAM